MEIEFNQPPEILYSYIENDLRNPTIIKNSYSKTISIEGTPNNNKIFGHFWNLERIQDYGNGTYVGSYFNPLQKANFTLYLNGEIYESGYFKLDKVRKTGNNVAYEITLYGGLGSFFYNLSYSHANGEVTGPDKLTLADLSFANEYGEPELDFNINKETVNTAWNTIIGGDPDMDPKYEIINFAPCYNGKPKDFDCNKAICNNNNPSRFIPKQSGVYRPLNPSTFQEDDNGYSMLETSEELTEWETCDLRSYLQRPVIRMKSIIEACCNPENNMGYEVDLDKSFFNMNNPYYEDTWLTMPMLRDLDIQNAEEVEASSETHLARIDKNKYQLSEDVSTLSEYSNVSISTKVLFQTTDDSEILYTNRYNHYRQKGLLDVVDKNPINNVILVQMVGFNKASEIIASSDLLYLTSNWPGGDIHDFFGDNFQNFSNYWNRITSAPVNNVVYERGFFKKINGRHTWCDYNGKEKIFTFKFNESKPVDKVEMRIAALSNNKAEFKIKIAGIASSWGYEPFVEETDTLYISTQATSTKRVTTTKQATELVQELLNTDITKGTFLLDMQNAAYQKTRKSDFFSNTKITKKDILTTDKTPCDYLLSYCKQFGLYFYKDANEESSDPIKYPNGVIHIMSRNTFYNTNNVVNLEDYIDRSKEMTITPQVASTKWYDWGLKVEDSEAEKDYLNATNIPFGTHRLNTGYNFDANKTDVFKDNAFKGGIMVSERDKYFQYPDTTGSFSTNTLYGIPTYAYNGLKVKLYDVTTDGRQETEATVLPIPLPKDKPICPVPGFNGYDLFPKLQFHGANNESTKGDGVLVFFRREQPQYESSVFGKAQFWLTDDTLGMSVLNEKPCWLFTLNERDSNNERIAIQRDTIPYFSRYIDYPGTGNITHTWDIGKSRGFIPYLFETDGMSIYEKVWKNYANDIYSVDGKLLTCYCLLENRPNPDWLRRFYWFDNSIWRLNRIIDWNVSSYDTTKMEFVKVQDLDNYQFDNITSEGKFYLKFEKDSISSDAQTVIGHMYGQDGGHLWLSDNIIVRYENGTEDYIPVDDCINPVNGDGIVEFTFHVPENISTMKRTFTISLPSEVSRFKTYEATLTQDANAPDIHPVTFETNLMTFNQEGQDDVELSFTTIDGVRDVTATTNSGWITIADVNDGYIVFHVSEMGIIGTRNGNITISCRYNGQTYTDICGIIQVNRKKPVINPDLPVIP